GASVASPESPCNLDAPKADPVDQTPALVAPTGLAHQAPEAAYQVASKDLPWRDRSWAMDSHQAPWAESGKRADGQSLLPSAPASSHGKFAVRIFLKRPVNILRGYGPAAFDQGLDGVTRRLAGLDLIVPPIAHGERINIAQAPGGLT